MKFNKVILIMLAGILVLALAFPPMSGGKAAAPTVKLNINNKVGEAFTLALTGPANYSWYIDTGKSTFDVLPGKYKYSYTACGGEKHGTVVIRKDGHTLTLAACKRQGQDNKGSALIKVNIQNNTSGTIRLYMVGPQTYNFTLPTGKSVINIVKGKYTYTVWGCGGASLSGTRNFGRGLVWKFWC